MSQILFGMMSVAVVAMLGWVIYTPSSDGPRIKRDFEKPGHKVTRIRRAGFLPGGQAQGPFSSYSRSWFRTYDVTVEVTGEGVEQHKVGVQVTLFGDPALIDFGSSYASKGRVIPGD